MLAMIKAILMVKTGVVLPTAGFESINPKIPDKDKIVVPGTPIPWPKGEKRRVMVTNFGENAVPTVSPESLADAALALQG